MKATVWISMGVVALLTSVAILNNAAAAGDNAVAAITKLENDGVKADLANDKSFDEKYLADDWTGGDSSGRWFTKKDALQMIEDTKNNKTNSEKTSERKAGMRRWPPIKTPTMRCCLASIACARSSRPICG